jgi:lipopolysaccharide transport system permease protein
MAKLILEAGRTEQQYWHDLWRYRELFYVLAWRDISVKYKQTTVGVGWALIQPLAAMLINTFIFGTIAKLPGGGVPYALLVFAGQWPYQFFSTSLNASASSLMGSAGLISKIYFPRMIVPAGAVVTNTVDFVVSGVIMVLLLIFYHWMPPVQVVLLPVFAIMAFLSALGPGLVATALNVKYRDFRIVVPWLISIGMYITPVAYLTSAIQHNSALGTWAPLVHALYYLNPITGVIDGFRWCLLGGSNELFLPGEAISFEVMVFFLYLGIRYFRSTERTFADVI